MQRNDINPFVNGLTVRYIEYTVDYGKFNPLADERYGYEVEQDFSCKLYVSKEIRDFIYSRLDIYARDMYLAVQYFCNPNYPYVILTKDKVDKLLGSSMSKRRFDDTLRILIKNAILDPKDRKTGAYWYNPNFFCAGNRLEMYEECKLKVATKMAIPRKLKS